MPTITLENQKIFYTYRKGPAAAPSALLIHGAGGSHLDWPAALRRLPNAAVYALDLPGHGRSEGPGRSTIDAYADTVQAFMARVELADVVPVGHSMGGGIAQILALRQLPALRGLVLLGSGARLPVNPTLLERTAEHFAETITFISRYAWSAEAPAEMVGAARTLFEENDPVTVQQDLEACNRFDAEEKLEMITLPTLVIGGSADRMTPPQFSRTLAARIPAAELLMVEGAGHMMALEQPEMVAEAVARFVNALDSATEA